MTDFTLSVAQSGPVQATVLTLLMLALITRIVVHLTAAPTQGTRTALHILDMVAAPLLAAFLLIILQRFWDLS